MGAASKGGAAVGLFRPFADYMLATHPDDLTRMMAQPTGGGLRPGLTPEALELWQRYVDEYVSVSGG